MVVSASDLYYTLTLISVHEVHLDRVYVPAFGARSELHVNLSRVYTVPERKQLLLYYAL